MYSRRDSNNNNDKDRNKAIAAIPIAGTVLATALMSGVVFLAGISYPLQAMAQQNMTGNATTTTTGGGGGGAAPSSACAPTGGGANVTGGGANVTGGNQSTSAVRMHIDEACMAAKNSDMQGVLMHLNLALQALSNMTTSAGGNVTTGAATGGNMTTSAGGNVTTGAATTGGTPPTGGAGAGGNSTSGGGGGPLEALKNLITGKK
jgi:hypothetical protein